MTSKLKREIQFWTVMVFIFLPCVGDLKLTAHAFGVMGLGCLLIDYTDRKLERKNNAK